MARGKMVRPVRLPIMARLNALAVACAVIRAIAAIPIMAKYVVRTLPMAPSHITAARAVVLLAMMDTINPAAAV